MSRYLLKLSGEALIGQYDHGIDHKVLNNISSDIVTVVNKGHELAIVVGGGNIFRGARLAQTGIDRVTGDNIGMLSTILGMFGMHFVDGARRIMRSIVGETKCHCSEITKCQLERNNQTSLTLNDLQFPDRKEASNLIALWILMHFLNHYIFILFLFLYIMSLPIAMPDVSRHFGMWFVSTIIYFLIITFLL